MNREKFFKALAKGMNISETELRDSLRSILYYFHLSLLGSLLKRFISTYMHIQIIFFKMPILSILRKPFLKILLTN